MAIWYVRHLATGANNGTSWANAYTSIFGAFTACAAGDTIYVADDNIGVFSPSTVSKGTFANPIYVIAAKPTATPPTSVPDPGSYATLSSSGDIYIEGVVYFYGIHFLISGSPTVPGSSSHSNCHFENCKFTFGNYLVVNNRTSTAHLSFSSEVRLTNCELVANGTTGFHIYSASGGTFRWRGGKYSRNPLATAPTSVLSGSSYDLRRWEFSGVDFSDANWTTPPQIGGGGVEFGKLNLTNCKLQTGQRAVEGNGHWSNGRLSIINTLHTQFTSSGGASYSSRTYTDAYYHGAYMDGFTSERVKVTPLSTISIAQPSSQRYSYVSDTATSPVFTYVYARFDAPIYFWNDIVGTPITVKLNMFIRAGTLTSDARRLEVQYPGDSGSPRTVIVRTGNDVTSYTNNGPPFGSAGTLTGTTSAWVPTFATEGGWPPHYEYDYSVTITPQAKGFIRLRYVKYGPVQEHQSGSTNFNPRPLIS